MLLSKFSRGFLLLLVCAVGLVGCDESNDDGAAFGGGGGSAAIPGASLTALSQTVYGNPGADLAITLTADNPDGDPLFFTIASPPANGTLSGSPPNVVYTPNAGFAGTDSFDFTAGDGQFESDTGTVTIRQQIGLVATITFGIENNLIFFAEHSLETIGSPVTIFGRPVQIVLSEDQSTAYVLTTAPNKIDVVDLGAQEIVEELEFDNELVGSSSPSQMVLGPDGFLYVCYQSDAFVTKVDPENGDTDDIEFDFKDSFFGGYAMAITPDGDNLYVAGADVLVKINLVDAKTSDVIDTGVGLEDIVIADSGIAYFSEDNGRVIEAYDTANDEFAKGGSIDIGIRSSILDMELVDGMIYCANDCTSANFLDIEGAALTIVDLERWSSEQSDLKCEGNYCSFAADDDTEVVELPFTFEFLGESYDEIFLSSDGNIGFGDDNVGHDFDIDELNGVAAITDDLYSEDDIFNYSYRFLEDRAIFQWCTAVFDSPFRQQTEYTLTFEIVLFADGRIRIDYLDSLPKAGDADGGFSYGIGDGKSAVINLREVAGSPYQFQNRSFLWDPTTPDEIADIPFEWEGTGSLHVSTYGRPDRLAVGDRRIFVTLPFLGGIEDLQGQGGEDLNLIQAFDRKTLAPLDLIPTGDLPVAIAVQR